MDSTETIPGLLPRIAGALGLGALGAAWTFRSARAVGEAEVSAQLYEPLGLWHNAHLELAAANAKGLDVALRTGLWVAGLALLGLALVWALPVLRSPERLARAFRGSLAPALSIALFAGFVFVGLGFLSEERALRSGGWIAPSDLAVAGWALGAGALWIALTTLVARAGSEGPEFRWRAAHVRALLVGGGILVGAGYWFNRSVWTPPADTGVLERNLAIGAAAFVGWAAMLWRWGKGGSLLVPGALATLAAVGFSFGPHLLLSDPGEDPSLLARRPLNVIVIGLDTVRADQTSLLGQLPTSVVNGETVERDTTPNLRRLAERGFNFTHAITQAPWTIPAFASVLTGKYPHEHGALVLDAKLSEKQVTLAEVLREAGYETYGVVSHLFLQDYRGFGQGFDHYDESPTLVPDIHTAKSSVPVTQSALSFLEQRTEDDPPFFLFAHYFDPHYEYVDHEAWDYADSYDGWFRDQLDFDNIQKHSRYLKAADRQWLIDLYHEEIEYTDRNIGRLLKYLDDSGLAETTLIVVVADHGEAFGEHGYYGHTIVLEQEVVHVPLLIVPPKGAPKFNPQTIDVPVETRGVFGTVLSYLKLEWDGEPRGAFQFDSALRNDLSRRSSGDGPKTAYSGVFLEGMPARFGKRFKRASLTEGKYKLILDMTLVEARLYDLEADPGERKPLGHGINKDVLVPMRERLQAWVRHMQEVKVSVDKAEVSGSAIEQLRQLGYAGGSELEDEEKE